MFDWKLSSAAADGTAVGQRLLGAGLQVQLAGSLDLALHMPRFVRPAEGDAWRRVSPDPAPFLNLPPVE